MNQSIFPNPEKIADEDLRRTGSILRLSAITLGVALLQAAVYLYFAVQLGAWQMAALTGILVVYAVANIISISFIRKGHLDTGTWIVLIGILIVFLSITLLVSGVGLILAASLILSLPVVNQTLSGRPARWAVFAGLAVSVLTALSDYIGLDYRLYLPEMQAIALSIMALIVLAIFFLVLPQSISQLTSLQVKMALWTGSILIGVSLILIAYATVTSRQVAIDSAEKEALSYAASQAVTIRADSEVPLDTARALAQSLTALKDPAGNLSLSRDQVNSMLRQVLIENPSFLGTYTLWEPDAFDNLDSAFAGKDAHDQTGRFIPYWVRNDDGSISVSALVDYEKPGAGDWYLLPRQTKREVAVAPVFYEIQGVNTVMASFVVPVIYDGKFYGIAGVDAPIAFVQKYVDAVDIYNGKAQAILMTSTGTLIGVSHQPDMVNQPATQVLPDFSDLQARIAAGEVFSSISPDGDYLRVFAPVDLGRSGQHWAFVLIVPFSEITSPATLAAVGQGLVGLVLLIFALGLLWFLIGQIVQPVRVLISVANAISEGDLNVRAEVKAVDETGVLANTFNLMVSQLREAFATLEQRVADRTRGLELASEVGRSVSQVRALDVMLTDAVEIIRSQFDLYYTQVYLTNPSQTELILQAGTGSVGAALLAREHRLPLNTGSINGRAAIDKRPVVISDTTASATFRPNPLLPDTRSEMAIPLIIGDRVVGVLDLQSQKVGALSPDTLSAFEALAGQLAVAIQNASFLAETEQARAEVENQARRLVRASWTDYMDAIHRPEHTGFVFEKNQILPAENVTDAPVSEGAGTLTADISVAGEPLGQLSVDLDEERQTTQTVELVNIVARQVAQQIENLRLLESAERYRAEAEEASRQLTREGWKNYMQANTHENLNYLYDLKEVRPLDSESNEPAKSSAVSLPIKIRDEVIGKFVVQGLHQNDSESVDLVTEVAERLGAHIESLRQFDETRRGQIELDKRARQLAAVAEISSVSSRELNIDKMLASVVHLTQRQFGLYHAHVFTYDENAATLVIAACGWKEGDEHEGTHGTTAIPLALEQSLVARAARSRQAVIANDVHSESGWLPNPMLPDTASEMAVPLIIGDQILGVLDVQSDRLNAFSNEDASIYTTLASQVSTALQNARSFVLAQKQAERETTLNIISQKIQSATTVEAVLQIAARELGHALGAPRTIAQLSVKDRK